VTAHLDLDATALDRAWNAGPNRQDTCGQARDVATARTYEVCVRLPASVLEPRDSIADVDAAHEAGVHERREVAIRRRTVTRGRQPRGELDLRSRSRTDDREHGDSLRRRTQSGCADRAPQLIPRHWAGAMIGW
jgi:hypothetical protein